MRPTHAILAATLLAGTLAGAARADGIGLSINIGEPGFFGRIDIGDAPAPQLVQRRPVWIERPRGAVMPQPIYLHVPPAHQRNWRRYCHQYNACGEPVLFVRDSWYQNSYVPHYRERNRHAEGERGDRNEHGDRNDRPERHDEDGRRGPATRRTWDRCTSRSTRPVMSRYRSGRASRRWHWAGSC